MRVLVVIDALGFGGAEMLLADLVTGVRDIGIEVVVTYLKERDGNAAAARLQALGVEPVPARIGGLLAPASLRTVREVVRRVRPDVVHTHLDYADLLGGLSARLERVPWVSTLHEMHWPRGSLRDRAKRSLFVRARRHLASRVISVSDAGRRAYLARGWDHPDHVVTIHNGIVDRRPTRLPGQVRAELGLSSDHVVVAMVSVLRQGKGHELAFEVVRRAAVRHPQLRLLVIGDGADREKVRGAASSLAGRVVFAGHRSDVTEVLAASDVLLHPSEFDAFPTAIIEAMAAGRPVVASSVGGIPELVLEGRTGLLAAPGDASAFLAALERLLVTPDVRRRFGEAGRRRFAEEFEAGAWAARLRAVYEEAAAGRSRPNSDPGAAASTIDASSAQSLDVGPSGSRTAASDP